MTRRIVCTDRPSTLRHDSDRSTWLLPQEMDWTVGEKSFDLLGTTDPLERLRVGESFQRHGQEGESFLLRVNTSNSSSREHVSCGMEQFSQRMVSSYEADEEVRAKLLQLLQAMWMVFDYEPKTIDQGIMWLGTEMVKRCLVVAEAFVLLENKKSLFCSAESLWQHSLRTGCLAGLLAKEEQKVVSVIAESCLAGFSHDIGLAILAVSFDSNRYLDVMAFARRRSLSLAAAELHKLGVSHEVVGAEYLQRMKFPKAIVDAVAFHDEPLGDSTSGLTPTIAVYAANILDGGGWPQDSNDIPSDRAMEYLSHHGLVDPWPKWRQCLDRIHRQEFWHV
ncbi:MAG: HDOD domain-containing protein [Nitrospirales bacterium]